MSITTAFMVITSAVSVFFLLMETDCASSCCGTYIRSIRILGELNCLNVGEETRDFIHVSDIMRAIDLIYLYDTETVNVANG